MSDKIKSLKPEITFSPDYVKKLMKRPSFQFYPSDWLRDTSLRTCSVGARGLWMDMICLMHEGNPYGHLRVSSKDILPPILSKIVGGSLSEVEGWLVELEESGVFSRTQEGTIFSRRMIRDENIRDLRAKGGGKSLENPNVPRPKEGYPSAHPSTHPLGGSLGGSPSSSSSSSSSNKEEGVDEETLRKAENDILLTNDSKCQTSDNNCMLPKPLAISHKPLQTRKAALSNDEFLETLKTNLAYSHINLQSELGKMDAWLLIHPGRQKTKRFILNWLNKIEKPMDITPKRKDIY